MKETFSLALVIVLLMAAVPGKALDASEPLDVFTFCYFYNLMGEALDIKTSFPNAIERDDRYGNYYDYISGLFILFDEETNYSTQMIGLINEEELEDQTKTVIYLMASMYVPDFSGTDFQNLLLDTYWKLIKHSGESGYKIGPYEFRYKETDGTKMVIVEFVKN